MSERDTTAQNFFEIVAGVDADDAARAHRIFFAAGDYTLNAFVRDSMTATTTNEEMTKQMAEYLVLLAAREHLSGDDMKLVMQEAEYRVADKYGLEIKRFES